MNFFPQMGLMNKQNIDKQQAINTAKEILYDLQDNDEVRNLIKNPLSSANFELIEETGNFNIFKFRENIAGFAVRIKIKNEPDITEAGGKELYQIHIELLSSRGAIITETYGYIMLK